MTFSEISALVGLTVSEVEARPDLAPPPVDHRESMMFLQLTTKLHALAGMTMANMIPGHVIIRRGVPDMVLKPPRPVHLMNDGQPSGTFTLKLPSLAFIAVTEWYIPQELVVPLVDEHVARALIKQHLPDKAEVITVMEWQVYRLRVLRALLREEKPE